MLAVVPSPPPAPGDTTSATLQALRVEAAGDSIKGFHNGTEVVRAVDSALTEPGPRRRAVAIAALARRRPDDQTSRPAGPRRPDDQTSRPTGQAGTALNVARVERCGAPMVSRWTGGSLPPRRGEAG